MKDRVIFIFKCLFGFVLILIPALVLAADDNTAIGMAGSSPLWDMFQNLSFSPPAGDMSVTYLRRIFGVVPGVPELAGGSYTLVGAVFGVFNAGILALSGIFLSYTITKIVTETTMDGAAMGKSTTIWTAIRCALSTSLLVPQVSGYSMVNGIVMWVVIQSIGLADLTWNRAMDYLEAGGPVYSPPQQFVDYSLLNYDVITGDSSVDNSNADSSVGAADVLRSLTCSHIIHSALKQNQRENRERLMAKPQPLSADDSRLYTSASKSIPEKGKTFSMYKHFGKPNYAYQFPFIEGEASGDNPLQDYGLSLESENIPKFTGKCGTIKYGVDNAPDDATRDLYTPAKLRGLQGMIAILEPVARRLVITMKKDKDAIAKLTAESREDKYSDTRLDPLTYIVHGRDTRILRETPEGSIGYGAENQTVEAYLLEPDVKKAINWPFGTDPLLQAAARYQLDLSIAQKGGAEASRRERGMAFKQAKQHGWIGAAGYYRLLASLNDDAVKNYDYYRLKGYRNLTQELVVASGTVRKVLDADAKPMDVLFPSMGIGSQIGLLSSDYQEIFADALVWIYLTYPYSELYGKYLIPDTYVAPTLSWFGSSSTWDKRGMKGLALGGIITQMVLGGLLLSNWVTTVIAIPLLTPVPLEFMAYNVDKVFDVWEDNMTNPSKVHLDPILKLRNLGDQMLRSVMDFVYQMMGFFAAMIVPVSTERIVWQMLSMAIAATTTIFGIGAGANVMMNSVMTTNAMFLDMALSIIYMFIPLAIAVMGPMFVSGVVFSVYVPLIPYLLFLFGSISWLISVLVLMIAAPIICFLMLWGNSSNENPMLSREAEQFVMQIIGVFLRPTLMVIGLIAGMALSYVGTDMLNLGFFKLVDELIKVEGAFDVMLIKEVAIIIVYTFTMLSVVNMCFSAIYLLYNEAMRVAAISAPAVGLEQQQMEAVKGGMTPFAEAAAGGLKETATSLKSNKAPTVSFGGKPDGGGEEESKDEGGDDQSGASGEGMEGGGGGEAAGGEAAGGGAAAGGAGGAGAVAGT